MKYKLLVVGTMAYDAIETPFGKVDKILGGAATYIGLAASRFSLDCGVVSVVGEDFEKEHLALLKDTVPFKVNRIGKGRVIILTDNTNFRASERLWIRV